MAGVLAVAVSAVLTGARSFAAIGEFAADLDAVQLGRLGLAKAPVESTMRKLFARVDAAALDAALAVFAWCRLGQVGGRRVIAIDGKTVRGARSATTSARHLIAALIAPVDLRLGARDDFEPAMQSRNPLSSSSSAAITPRSSARYILTR